MKGLEVKYLQYWIGMDKLKILKSLAWVLILFFPLLVPPGLFQLQDNKTFLIEQKIWLLSAIRQNDTLVAKYELVPTRNFIKRILFS